MEGKRKTVLRIALALAAGVCLLLLSAFVYFKFFFKLDLLKEGPTAQVKVEGWPKLQTGMSKDEVASLLGPSSCKTKVESNDKDGKASITMDFWEYNWTGGLSLIASAHPKAYVVYFDKDGKLSSWREPLEKDASSPERK